LKKQNKKPRLKLLSLITIIVNEEQTDIFCKKYNYA